MEIIPLSREGAWYIIVAALIGYGPYNGLFLSSHKIRAYCCYVMTRQEIWRVPKDIHYVKTYYM